VPSGENTWRLATVCPLVAERPVQRVVAVGRPGPHREVRAHANARRCVQHGHRHRDHRLVRRPDDRERVAARTFLQLAVLDSIRGIGCLHRRFRNLTTYVDRARGKSSHLADAAPCVDARSTVLPFLQFDVFDALDLDPEETSWSGPRRQDMRNSAVGSKIAIRIPLALSSRQLPLRLLDRQRPTQHLQSLNATSETKLHGEWQGGAMLAQAGLPFCTGSGHEGQFWRKPACIPRPRRPTRTRRRARWQGCRHASRPCL
jgi:hypothetical protein